MQEFPMKEASTPNTATSASRTCHRLEVRDPLHRPTAREDHDGRRPRAAAVQGRVTSESHPFYTGTQKSVDSLGGRVEKVPQQVCAPEHGKK
jgi:ribosomal protein L31